MVATLAAGWFIGLWAFVAVMHVKARWDSMTLFWKVNLFPLAVIGWALDILLFNWIFGTIMFIEWPEELTLTSRLKRHYRTSDGWRLRVASFWRKQLNIMDPGHVD